MCTLVVAHCEKQQANRKNLPFDSLDEQEKSVSWGFGNDGMGRVGPVYI